MAKFTFGKTVDIHWNGYEIVGPALTEFSIPDQLYEEFEGDFRDIEPSLTWTDTNEFATLSASVSASTITATAPIAVTSTSTGKNISFSSGTALNGYLLAANGSGGSIWTPASTSSLTSVVGVSPISSIISGGTVSVSLNASYSTSTHDHAGTYQVAGSYSTSTHTHADIPLSTVTAKGDLIAATGSAAVSPLPVGTDGQILSASSGATTGLAWIDQTAVTSDNAARIRTLVRNATVSTIAKGSVVYLKSSSGLVPTVELALATADATSANTIGIVEADISSNANGYITNVGKLTALNTSGFADGAALYLSATVAGSFQTAKPTGPSHGVLVGFVIKGGSVGAGEIYVYVKNGSELDEIHDVNISSVVNGQALIWSSSASVWQNQALPVSAVIGTSPASVSTTSGTSTVSIVAASINSTHLSAASVGSSQLIAGSVNSAAIAAGAVNTSAINAGAATSGQLLQATGTLGQAIFATVPTGVSINISEFTASGTWTKPSGVSVAYVFLMGGGGGGGGGARVTGGAAIGGGGGGGRPAGYREKIIPASILASTVSVTIAAGGIGGAATTATTTLFITGNAGSSGGITYFGNSTDYYLSAANGDGGVQGQGAAPAAQYGLTPIGAPMFGNGSNAGIGYNLDVGSNANNTYYAAPGGTGGTNSGTVGNRVGATNGALGMNTFIGFSAISAGTATTALLRDGANAPATALGAGGGGGFYGGPSATAGNGGSGSRGGGGGGGGASLTSLANNTLSGAGGNGGSGYALIISW